MRLHGQVAWFRQILPQEERTRPERRRGGRLRREQHFAEQGKLRVTHLPVPVSGRWAVTKTGKEEVSHFVMGMTEAGWRHRPRSLRLSCRRQRNRRVGMLGAGLDPAAGEEKSAQCIIGREERAYVGAGCGAARHPAPTLRLFSSCPPSAVQPRGGRAANGPSPPARPRSLARRRGGDVQCTANARKAPAQEVRISDALPLPSPRQYSTLNVGLSSGRHLRLSYIRARGGNIRMPQPFL